MRCVRPWLGFAPPTLILTTTKNCIEMLLVLCILIREKCPKKKVFEKLS